MQKSEKGTFIHLVLFWLKEPQNESSKSQFLENLRILTQECDEQVSSEIGVPANTPRPVVDSSYTFSLHITLKDSAQHDRYQVHPAHVKFVENNKHLWSKVQIFDSISI